MKNVPMRFAGYTFGHNPAKLKIEDAAHIALIQTPFAPPDSRHMGRKARIIRGEGELYGTDCIEQYRELYALYERAERGMLSLPKMPPMTAYLKELYLEAQASENVLSFGFTFVEAQGASVGVTADSVYTVSVDGESLWDIAYVSGLSIDEAVRLNPQIPDIGSLSAGEAVRLC